jgi:hypothetical protein
MPTSTTVENTDHLTADEKRLVSALAHSHFDNLDAAAAWLYVLFPTWFVHHGGTHLALHRYQAEGEPRVAIIVEDLLAPSDESEAERRARRDDFDLRR